MSLLTQGQPTNVDTDLTTEAPATTEGPAQGTPDSIDWESRYKHLQSYSDKRRIEYERQLEELKKETGKFVPPRTKEELDDFKARNPEHFGTIETVAHLLVQDQVAPLREELEDAKRKAAVAELTQAHPDFANFAGDPKFLAWAEAEGISDWLTEELDPSKPIRALSFYKNFLVSQQAHTDTQAQPTASNPAAQAVNVNSGAPAPTGTEGLRTFTRAQIEAMNVSEYELHEEAIRAAAKAGLIR